MRPNPLDVAALIAIRLVLAMLLIVGFVLLLAGVATRRQRERVVSVLRRSDVTSATRGVSRSRYV